MAYKGYILKMNGTIIPNKFMSTDNCNITNNTQHLDDWTDLNGDLHTNVLPKAKVKIEWNFPFGKNSKLQELLAIFRSIWGTSTKRETTCEVYVPEYDDYRTGIFYMPDPKFGIYMATDSDIVYNATRFALIQKE